MAPPARGQLAGALQRIIELRRTLRADADLRSRWVAVKAFQARRLRTTYPDLLASPRFRPACEFFLDELYGAHDFDLRDREALRAVSSLEALLPARAITTIAQAVELDELTERLDARLAAALPADSAAAERIATAYAAAYRISSTPAERACQLQDIVAIGRSLEGLAAIKLLPQLLKLMRRPAEAAGLGHLHRFLARGFDAFRQMRTAEEFLAVVLERETALMDGLFAGADLDAAAAAAAGRRPAAQK